MYTVITLSEFLRVFLQGSERHLATSMFTDLPPHVFHKSWLKNLRKSALWLNKRSGRPCWICLSPGLTPSCVYGFFSGWDKRSGQHGGKSLSKRFRVGPCVSGSGNSHTLRFLPNPAPCRSQPRLAPKCPSAPC